MAETIVTDGLESPSPTEPLPSPASPAEAGPAERAGRLASRSLTDWLGYGFDLLLVALVVVGVVLRFAWVDWDEETLLHPDEYGLTNTLTRLSLPKTFGDYFNTRLSPLSPYQKYDVDGLPTDPGPDNRMRWGQWPITIIRFVAELTDNAGFIELRRTGRVLSAVFDTLSLLVLYLIGARLFGRRVGLLATALSALAVMQIQQSHFMTADNFAVLFVMLAMYCAVRVATPTPTRTLPHLRTQMGEGRGGGWIWYVLFGVFCGMAIASRVNLLPLIAEIVVAAFIVHTGELLGEKNDSQFMMAVGKVTGLLMVAGLATVLTFRVTHPMAFRAPVGDTTLFTFTLNPDWVASMEVAQAESNGIGGPPSEQWTNRPAIVFPLTNMVIWGMGLPLGVAAWAGLLWALRRVIKRDGWQSHLLPLTWAGGYFLFMGTRFVKSMRYFLPIYPFLALFAAWGLLELWKIAGGMKDQGRARLAMVLRITSAVAVAVVALGTLTWAWGFTSVYRTENTRVRASRWIYQNVPAPINLRVETASGVYSEPLPLPAGNQLSSDFNYPVTFVPRVTGTINQLSIGYARNLFGVEQPITIRAVLASDPGGLQPLARADLHVNPSNKDLRGGTAVSAFGPAQVTQGQTYYLILTVPEGGPATLTGATIANENWDEGLPLRVEGRDGFGGLYQGLTNEVRWNDDESKRLMFMQVLSQADYLILPSQRGIWSTSRLPNTYPMTMEYYRALFDGRLGFDLAATFTSPITIGPLEISDVGGSAAWNETPKLPLFNDNPLAAEEAFSVYDHAPVWIFKKRPDFDLNKAMEVLNAVDLTQVVVQGPREATAAPTLLMLPSDRLVEQRAGGTWSEMFDPDSPLNKYQPLGVVVWWLTCVVLGWVAFPIAFVALPGLPDRGYALTRNLSLLLIAWLSWLFASFRILPFTQACLWLMAGVMALVSGLIAWRRREALAAWVHENGRYVLIVEGLALLLFVAFLSIRLGNPDLWHPAKGGEKPMDFSYFNAVLKSTSFPPYDPWFSGGYLNYYYFGFVIVATLTKMLGIVPSFAYNLILPMLFSMAGMGAFCVAFNLVAGGQRLASETLPSKGSLQRILANPYLAGVAATLLFVVLGNLGEWDVIMGAIRRVASDVRPVVPLQFVADWQRLAVGLWRVYALRYPVSIGLDQWYWNATRVIPDSQTIPITEFPFFTFLYADLHAHMIVLTITVIALAWALSVVLSAKAAGRGWIEQAAMWVVAGVVFGSIQPSNLSDYQTYWALGCIAIAYGELRKRNQIDLEFLKQTGWRCAVLVGLSIAFFWPYTHWRGEGYGSVELWKGDKTPLDPYITIHGLFLFIIFIFLLTETRRWMQRTLLEDVQDLLGPAAFALFAFVLMVFGLWWLRYEVALVALPLMAWTGLLLIRKDAEPERRATLGLIGLGLLLTVAVEVVVAKGDIGRMNTVFKFYLQVWTLFSVAGGAALAWIWAQMPEWRMLSRGVVQFGLTVLVTGAALYTVLATSAKIQDRFPPYQAVVSDDPQTDCKILPDQPAPYEQSLPVRQQPHSLDSADYMQWSAYCDQGYFVPLQYDYEALRWMQDNVRGSPVIVEVNAPEYRWGSRFTINTGLPGVLGWNWHQRQQRVVLPDRVVWDRANAINSFYMTFDEKEAMDFLIRYDVTYVIVGQYERAYYPPLSLAKFDSMVKSGMLKVAYQNEGTVIYEVVGGGTTVGSQWMTDSNMVRR